MATTPWNHATGGGGGVLSAIEPLEARRLFDAVLTDGVLMVTGSSGPDEIRIWRQPGPTDAPVWAVSISDGTTQPPRGGMFPLGQVRSIVVRSGAGGDTVDLAAATWPIPESLQYGPVSIPSRIDAGLGNDVVHGGTSRDMIVDPFGDDEVYGNGGDDWINGGWGDDFLSGGPGNDFVFGGFGDDFVHGDEGNDRLDGGPGSDHVGVNGVGPRPAEPGDDLLFGGPGEDWMVGGLGTDRVFGGPGRDHFSRWDDEAEMIDRTPDEPDDVPMLR